LRDWLVALAGVRALWPLPALLFLGLVLPFSPGLWVLQFRSRRVWSVAELALVCSCAGTLLYWLMLLLSRAGLLGKGRTLGMREPSDLELRIVEVATLGLCLLMAYAGPLLVLLAP
jgi:hypothetical protein